MTISSIDVYTASGSAASRALSTRAPTPFDLELALVFLRSGTVECTSVTHGNGTFTRLFRQVSTNSSLELWAGYGFATGEIDADTNFTFSSSIVHGVFVNYFRNGAVQNLPTLVVPVVGAAGVSTTAAAAELTPTAKDESQLSFTGAGHATINTPTWTSSPGNNEGYLASGLQLTTGYLSRGRRVINSLSPHNLVTNVPSSAEWVAIHALLQPTLVTPSTDPVHVYKGRSKKSLDTIGAT